MESLTYILMVDLHLHVVPDFISVSEGVLSWIMEVNVVYHPPHDGVVGGSSGEGLRHPEAVLLACCLGVIDEGDSEHVSI